MKNKYDIIVIGSGPGGEGAAMQASKAGKSVAVIDGLPEVGGNCTHKGTIPSKALRHAIFAGTSERGGAVAIVGDDPAAKSSTVPSSSAGLLADMHMPLLYPGDPAEALWLGRHAIQLSRVTGLWSAIKIVADVADATASVELDAEAFAPIVPLQDGRRYRHRPDGRLLTPHTLDLEREILEVRYELARRYASDNRLNAVTVDPNDAWIGIVSSGITYREVRQALARMGLADDAEIAACGIRLLKMGMPMPFNPETVRLFSRGLDEVLVIEEKQPNIESLIKDALYALTTRPRVVGKADEAGERLLPAYGALDADIIGPILRMRLERRLHDRLGPALPEPRPHDVPTTSQRLPFFCSGCPHNRSTEVPEGSRVGAGIGCHTMTLLMEPERVGDIVGLTCMGNEGAHWIGMADFLERDHLLQNLGDGTYFHSGQLAVQAAVAAGSHVTFKLLYNGAVAMTGGQPVPGGRSVGDVARVLQAQGVARVLVTTDEPGKYTDGELPGGVDVWDRTRLVEAQRTLAETDGVTVLIHDQECAAELRRARKRGLAETPNRRVVINPRICEGCGDCGRVSNCLSVQPVQTPFGRKTRIDQTSCNFDESCLEGDCPSFMTVTQRAPGPLARLLGSGGADPAPPRRIPEPPTDLPAPVLCVPDDAFAARITGIGGTGVVTVAQVLGTAAMLDGYHVRGLDQIGLSQKAGPVVSDVRLSRTAPTATNRLGRGQADLLLAFDALVAASEKGLLTADRSRTVVVGSSSDTPTGEMIAHPERPASTHHELAARIAAETRADAQHWADAQAITRELLGDTATANLFVVGMAFQAGSLPISAASIEAAIELNRVAVDANRAAFHWGRAQIARPEALAELLAGPTSAELDAAMAPLPAPVQAALDRLGVGGETERDLARYARELLGWGDERTALGWLAVLDRVAEAERRVDPKSTRLLEAVAANLFRLVAYKDEYEVARLMTDPGGMADARALAGGGGKLAWRLHPPLLRALGMRRKIAIGSWATPAVRLLASAKFLRGTPLDPFGQTGVRRLERALPAEYIEAIDQVLATVTRDTLDSAVTLAGLPEEVRGYEHLKLTRVALYREKLAGALAAFS